MLKDQRELLDAFNAHGVEYVVVGGHAVGAYGEPRLTKDLDILIRSTRENSERVYRALAAYGAPMADYQPSDFFDKPEQIVQFGIPPNRIDLLQSISGVSTEDIWRDHTQKVLPGGTVANLISLEHLIKNKQSAGRRQDLADVEKLQQYGMEE